MEIHARALYVHDDRGRLVAVNDPYRDPAARFFLGRTAQGAIWRLRHDLPAELSRRLGELAAAEPPATDRNLERPPTCLHAVRAALAEHGPVDTAREGGPAYRFPPVLEAP